MLAKCQEKTKLQGVKSKQEASLPFFKCSLLAPRFQATLVRSRNPSTIILHQLQFLEHAIHHKAQGHTCLIHYHHRRRRRGIPRTPTRDNRRTHSCSRSALLFDPPCASQQNEKLDVMIYIQRVQEKSDIYLCLERENDEQQINRSIRDTHLF